jgi:hypothetical protein
LQQEQQQVLVREREPVQLLELVRVQQQVQVRVLGLRVQVRRQEQWHHRSRAQPLRESSSHHASIGQKRLSRCRPRYFSSCEFPERQQRMRVLR